MKRLIYTFYYLPKYQHTTRPKVRDFLFISHSGNVGVLIFLWIPQVSPVSPLRSKHTVAFPALRYCLTNSSESHSGASSVAVARGKAVSRLGKCQVIKSFSQAYVGPQRACVHPPRVPSTAGWREAHCGSQPHQCYSSIHGSSAFAAAGRQCQRH